MKKTFLKSVAAVATVAATLMLSSVVAMAAGTSSLKFSNDTGDKITLAKGNYYYTSTGEETSDTSQAYFTVYLNGNRSIDTEGIFEIGSSSDTISFTTTEVNSVLTIENTKKAKSDRTIIFSAQPEGSEITNNPDNVREVNTYTINLKGIGTYTFHFSGSYYLDTLTVEEKSSNAYKFVADAGSHSGTFVFSPAEIESLDGSNVTITYNGTDGYMEPVTVKATEDNFELDSTSMPKTATYKGNLDLIPMYTIAASDISALGDKINADGALTEDTIIGKYYVQKGVAYKNTTQVQVSETQTIKFTLLSEGKFSIKNLTGANSSSKRSLVLLDSSGTDILASHDEVKGLLSSDKINLTDIVLSKGTYTIAGAKFDNDSSAVRFDSVSIVGTLEDASLPGTIASTVTKMGIGDYYALDMAGKFVYIIHPVKESDENYDTADKLVLYSKDASGTVGEKLVDTTEIYEEIQFAEGDVLKLADLDDSEVVGMYAVRQAADTPKAPTGTNYYFQLESAN